MPSPTGPQPEFLERARALHREALVMDAHVDTVSEMLDQGYDLAQAPETAHLTWKTMAEGGLKAQVFAAYVSPSFIPDRCKARVDAIVDRFEQEVARFPEQLAFCRSAAEVEAARRAGKFAGMMSIEGGHAIEDSLDTLRHFHRRGIRAMTLTWNNTNSWADGCGPMDKRLVQHGGLTDFGRAVVAAMEGIGMAVDVSHAAPATFRDVMAVAKKAPFASHSSCRAQNDHRRNLTDDEMRALAQKGGVMGICFLSGFLVEEARAWARAKQTSEYAAVTERTDHVDFAGITDEEYTVYNRHVPLASVDDAARHVDHALRTMGTSAVALGSDFDGGRRFPAGLGHAGELPNLTAHLLERGWREEELRGFLGENLLDYFRRTIG